MNVLLEYLLGHIKVVELLESIRTFDCPFNLSIVNVLLLQEAWVVIILALISENIFNHENFLGELLPYQLSDRLWL